MPKPSEHSLCDQTPETLPPEVRRRPLLQWNSEQDASGRSCAGCSGTCCTFAANSVRLTPLETRDLYTHLNDQGLWTSDLRDHLRRNIDRFQLDRPAPGDGRRSYGRRRYTCPFFQERSLGCPLPREIKPYGCLGFHASRVGVGDGEGCGSDRDRLINREEIDPGEEPVNRQLVRQWQWPEDKLPIPVALLSLDPSP